MQHDSRARAQEPEVAADEAYVIGAADMLEVQVWDN